MTDVPYRESLLLSLRSTATQLGFTRPSLATCSIDFRMGVNQSDLNFTYINFWLLLPIACSRLRQGNQAFPVSRRRLLVHQSTCGRTLSMRKECATICRSKWFEFWRIRLSIIILIRITALFTNFRSMLLENKRFLMLWDANAKNLKYVRVCFIRSNFFQFNTTMLELKIRNKSYLRITCAT